MSDLKIYHSVTEFRKSRAEIPSSVSVGFIPTMGALHEGHAALIRQSQIENQHTVVSIFVNPTQFNSTNDLEKYPRTMENDLKLCKDNGAQAVLLPTYEQIYTDQYRYKISESSFSKILCGLHRPGHFDGVLTVVMKLLQIVQPRRAYFGKKDYQQYLLIQEMAHSFFLNVEIIGCETVRELDGLAMSSRNLRLSAEGRKTAAHLYQAIKNSQNLTEARELLLRRNIEVEYLEEHYHRRFIAAFIDGVRLIDNVEIGS